MTQPMAQESQNIEWKQSWRDDYMKWICGFANAKGGRIYIGKNDAGEAVGLPQAKKLLEDLPNRIRDQLGLMPEINLHEENSKSYLEIIVEPSTVAISLRGSYYWRSGSVKQELKGHALTAFLLKKTGTTWDRLVTEKATLDDIDEGAIEHFAKDAARAGRLPDLSQLSTKEVLKKLHLLTKEGLTHAALVLFGKNPGEFFPNLFVKIGRFGENKVDMRFQEVCEGNLIQLLGDVMEMLEKKFLIKPVRFEDINRIEELEYPVDALREMLLNALVHRDYLGSMTQIKVFDDQLDIWNAGQLPEGLTIKKLFQTHESIPRNPLIAQVCYHAGYIDSWGRGIEKIADACKQTGMPAPSISKRMSGVAVALMKTRVKTPVKTRVKTPVETPVKTPVKTRVETPVKTRVETPVETRVKTPEAVLQALKKDSSLTLAEVADRIGKSVSAVERAAKKLDDQGKIKYIGPQKGGHWEIRG